MIKTHKTSIYIDGTMFFSIKDFIIYTLFLNAFKCILHLFHAPRDRQLFCTEYKHNTITWILRMDIL